jgi:HTH-type transcriptional regulator/antitoxin HigA
MKSPRKAKLHDDYLALVRAFPLIAIKDDQHHREALAVIDRLAVCDETSLSRGETDYLDALCLLTEAYASTRFEAAALHMSPGEALRYVMEVSGTSSADLAPLFGARATVEDVLKGKREMTKKQVIALAARFHVEPGLFMEGWREQAA